MRRLITGILLICLFYSCSKDSLLELEHTFVIKKGDHRDMVEPVLMLADRELEGSIFIHPSMIAQEGFTSKIVGISSPDNHNNSARIGWITVGDKIELRSYVYSNGHCPQAHPEYKQTLGVYTPPVEVFYSISHSGNAWHFQVNEYRQDIPGKMPLIRYISQPYYGGEPAAPHDIIVKVTYKIK